MAKRASNASPYQNDLEEDSPFAPEIVEDLETNILGCESDMELEIPELLEDDVI